jgi:hypothetical protein
VAYGVHVAKQHEAEEFLWFIEHHDDALGEKVEVFVFVWAQLGSEQKQSEDLQFHEVFIFVFLHNKFSALEYFFKQNSPFVTLQLLVANSQNGLENVVANLVTHFRLFQQLVAPLKVFPQQINQNRPAGLDYFRVRDRVEHEQKRVELLLAKVVKALYNGKALALHLGLQVPIQQQQVVEHVVLVKLHCRRLVQSLVGVQNYSLVEWSVDQNLGVSHRLNQPNENYLVAPEVVARQQVDRRQKTPVHAGIYLQLLPENICDKRLHSLV